MKTSREERKMKKFLIKKEHELKAVVDEIHKLMQYDLVFLIGDLGAGKTTFVKYLMAKLASSAQVSSPTFSIMNEYLSSDNELIYHMDLYRLESIDEALHIGIEEYLDSPNLKIIEWPEIINELVNYPHHTIEIKIVEDIQRELIFY